MIIVIPTCPAYSDVLKVFMFFLKRNWANCKFNIFTINAIDRFPSITNFNTPDEGWVANLLKFIHNKGITENILILLDDYLLMKPIINEEIENINASITDRIGYIRLTPFSNNAYNEGYGWVEKSSKFYSKHYLEAYVNRNPQTKRSGLAISLQPAIWSIDFVRTYFNPSWSPWQQEVIGSSELARQNTVGGLRCSYRLLTTKRTVYQYLNAIRDGKYAQEFEALVKRTPELHDFAFIRDVAKKYTDLSPAETREILRRQNDGTYPSERYVNPLL